MAEQDLKIVLSGESSGFIAAIQKAVEQFKTGMKGIEADSVQAKKSLNDAFSTLDVRPFKEIEAEAIKVKEAFNTIYQSAGTTGTEVQAAAQAMKTKLAELSAEMQGNTSNTNNLGESFNGLKGKVLGAVAAFVSFQAIKGMFDAIITEGSEAEQQLLKLSSALGGGADASALAKEKLSELSDEANRLGQDNDALAENYIKLTLAAKGTANAGAVLETSFKAVNDIVGSLGLSTEQAASITELLAKAFTKGSASTKELRGVLLEAGISMEAFAAASGKSLADLNDDLKDSTLTVQELVTGLSNVANVDLAGQSENFAKTFSGQVQIIKNSLANLFESIATSGVFEAVKEQLNAIIATFKKMADDGSLQKFASGLGDALGTLVQVFGTLAKIVVEFKGSILALVGTGLVAWAANAVTSLIAFTAATEATAGGVTALTLAIRAIPLVAAFLAGFAIGDLIYEKFLSAESSIRKTKTAVEELRNEIKQLSGGDLSVSMSKVASTVEKEFAGATEKAKQGLKNLTTSVNEEEKKASAAYKASSDARASQEIAANEAYLQGKRDLAARGKVIEKEKSDYQALERIKGEQEQRAAIDREIAANHTKNVTLANAEKEVADARASAAKVADLQLDASTKKFVKDNAQSRVKAQEEIVQQIKTSTDLQTQNEKIAGELRALENKKITNRIAQNEADLKADEKRLLEQRSADENDFVIRSKAAAERRSAAIMQANSTLSGGFDRYVIEERKILEEKGTREIQLVRSANAVMNQEIARGAAEKAANVQKDYATQRNELSAFGLWLSSNLGNQAKEFRKQAIESSAAAREGTNLVIEAKEKLRVGLASKMKEIEAVIQGHTTKIVSLEKELADSATRIANKKFEFSLINTNDTQKLDLMLTRVNELQGKMRDLNAEAANNKGVFTDAQIKQIEEYRRESDSLITSAASLTKTEDGVTKTLLEKGEALAMVAKNEELATTSTKMRIEREKEQKKGQEEILKGVKAEAESLNKELTALNELKLKIELDSKDIIRTNENLERLKELAKSGFSVDVRLGDAQTLVNNFQKSLQKPTKADHEIIPETSKVDGAINRIKQPTQSTHTIIEKRVPASSSGDDTQTFATGGFVQGAGTDTSDSIHAMLSNNEFIIKAAAVKKFGVNFFNNLNNGYAPPSIPRFATGGLVGGGSSSRNDTMNLNISLGGNTYQVQSARSQAMGLAGALQQLSRAS